MCHDGGGTEPTMTPAFRMKVDKAAIAQAKKELTALQRAGQRAAQNAGDKAGRSLTTALVKYLRTRRNLKAGFVRAGMRLIRPSRGTTIEAMIWQVRVVGKPVPLASYPHSSGRGLLKVRVKPGGASVLPHSFTAPALDAKIYRRVGTARGPLKQLFSSPITAVLESGRGIIERLRAEAVSALRVSFASGLDAQLGKIK